MDDMSHLFSAYFYEAWDGHEYSSWHEAVDDFARRSPERVAGAVGAIQALLDERLDDDALSERLRLAGCTYAPDEGDRGWLHDVLDRLRRQTDGRALRVTS